jgi:asparagine synthase (glutamine-hydrolysing)
MSMQAGIWNRDGRPANSGALAGISKCFEEYGPDGESTVVEGELGMLYRPFHTTPESRLEVQPFRTTGGRMILWDGRLDNREELLRELAVGLSSDQTDVALAAAAFERWGTACFPRLIGDWALSIWDPRERELILARDYLGVRHLFYLPESERVIWCTHLAPLISGGGQVTLNPEYIAGYLAFYAEPHLTPYREIHSVPPGSFVRLRQSKMSVHEYWPPEPRFRIRYKTDAEYEEHYRFLFRQAVRRRLHTDSPILAELSGGLDSSSIVCMADHIMAAESVEAPRLDTLSGYDSNEPGEEDSAFFIKVEEKRGRKGLVLDLKASGDSLPFEYSSFVPIPGFGDRSEVRAAMSEILGRKQYRVMLSGLGGDEMNGMALDPRVLLADLFGRFRIVGFSRQLAAWSLLIRKPVIQLFFEALAHFLPAAVRAQVTDYAKLEPWINRSFARKYRFSYRQLRVMKGIWFYRPGVRDTTEGLLGLSMQMTHLCPAPIELRHPFLDRTLVEFLTSIPLSQLSRAGERRSLMRRALKDLLPPEVGKRRTKATASRCYSVSIDKHWDRIQEVLLSPRLSSLGYVDTAGLQTALLEMRHGNVPKYILRLLNALSLELWLRDLEARGVLPVQSSTHRLPGVELAATGA